MFYSCLVVDIKSSDPDQIDENLINTFTSSKSLMHTLALIGVPSVLLCHRIATMCPLDDIIQMYIIRLSRVTFDEESAHAFLSLCSICKVREVEMDNVSFPSHIPTNGGLAPTNVCKFVRLQNMSIESINFVFKYFVGSFMYTIEFRKMHFSCVDGLAFEDLYKDKSFENLRFVFHACMICPRHITDLLYWIGVSPNALKNDLIVQNGALSITDCMCVHRELATFPENVYPFDMQNFRMPAPIRIQLTNTTIRSTKLQSMVLKPIASDASIMEQLHGEYENLTQLCVTGNDYEHLLSNNFTAPNLSHLILRNTRISKIPVRLQSLKTLEIHCDGGIFDFTSLKNARQLEKLHVHGYEISHITIGHLITYLSQPHSRSLRDLYTSTGSSAELLELMWKSLEHHTKLKQISIYTGIDNHSDATILSITHVLSSNRRLESIFIPCAAPTPKMMHSIIHEHAELEHIGFLDPTGDTVAWVREIVMRNSHNKSIKIKTLQERCNEVLKKSRNDIIFKPRIIDLHRK